MPKPHFNKGNKHAVKDGRDASMRIRVPSESKAKWVEQAKSEDITLSDYAIRQMNKGLEKS